LNHVVIFAGREGTFSFEKEISIALSHWVEAL